MHEAGHSKPVLWDNLEGWGGEGGGSRLQDRGINRLMDANKDVKVITHKC